MFRIKKDPSSGSLVQCLAKNYMNDSIVSVDMDKVGVMAAYCDRLCVCVCARVCVCVCSSLFVCIYIYIYIYTQTRLPDDGASLIRNMLGHF
jgi:hypothetical protein